MERLDQEGRIHYSKTGYARQKKYLEESRDVPIQDVWEDIPSLSGQHSERLGYPTHKPHLSIALLKYRLQDMFPGITFEVIGEPKDVGAAHQLALDDRYQFQWWALSLIRAPSLLYRRTELDRA
jgi:hypothetical protein